MLAPEVEAMIVVLDRAIALPIFEFTLPRELVESPLSIPLLPTGPNPDSALSRTTYPGPVSFIFGSNLNVLPL